MFVYLKLQHGQNFPSLSTFAGPTPVDTGRVPSISAVPCTSVNLHFGQHGVSRRVGEAEQEAVGRHLHVGREDEHHSALVHVPLGEATFDVSSC